MMCPYPITVKDKYGYIHTIACGRCKACRLNSARDWSIRIMNELVYHEDACFITLTYDDDHLPEDYSISKREWQLFMKRFRKLKNVKEIRYFASGEYGDKGTRWINPHYHAILFGVSRCDDVFKLVETRRSKRGFEGFEVKLDAWDKGSVYVADVSYDSACYVAKYNCKSLGSLGDKIAPDEWYDEHGLARPFILMSRRPGLGARYVRDNQKKLVRRNYVVGKNGIKYSLPRFYRSKLDLPKIPGSYVAGIREEKREWDLTTGKKYGKSFSQYKNELLLNAKNILDSLIRRSSEK